ncbi:unnamed protein product [Oppiella nova]|uniref:C2H2-type domain-containing protein n=1 Tax=Oppiella nova TaxID=334625 RepID=A0A7R9QX37_9ACAR|nr:unnamed protein product [Oppiella nova]CAG2177209.1 unnamed protein product [Oppiella nova]
MPRVLTRKRSANARKRNVGNRSSNKRVEVKNERQVSIETSVDHKSNVKTRRKCVEVDNGLSPKRLRKQRFGHEMYGKDCSESSDKNENIENDLDAHESLHSAKSLLAIGSIGCDLCDKKFDNKQKLCRHLKSVHKMDKLIASRLPFPELVESDSGADSEGRIQCGKCCFRTDSEALMILHSINHNVLIIDHINGAIKSRLKCPTCDQWFTKSLLQKHVYIHTSEKPYKCDECLEEFTTSSHLTNHQMKHNPTMDSLITCSICGTAFKTKKSFQKHQMIHKTDRKRSHLCDVCGIGFYDKESLKSHTFRIHLPKNVRKFKCDFSGCRYSCLYQHQMVEHQKVHSDDKPWVCDQCDYTAKSKWTFKKHYRKHTKEKPFQCPHCEYASSLSSNLRRHVRIHTGSKPFKCPYCNYRCNNHENLRKHVLNTRKHKGLYLYNCMHCVFATNVFSDLRQHMEQIHKDIYTIEQIDRMISSIYHKQEDNTTVVPITHSTEPQTDASSEKTTNRKSKKMKTESKDTMDAIERHTNCSSEVIIANDFDELKFETQNDDSDVNKSIVIGKSMAQNNSEMIIIDSNVLEAQEVCVTDRLVPQNNTHFLITVCKK